MRYPRKSLGQAWKAPGIGECLANLLRADLEGLIGSLPDSNMKVLACHEFGSAPN